MCGIAGWLGHLTESNCVAERIMQLLHHRGPDANGFREWHDATLIHTRLSVIDPSGAGSQPMPNKNGSIWVVFNGEIYNHRELRRYLESRGHHFKGRSDTEVLAYLYEEEEERLVTRLRGMFALAIYDLRNRTLLLARDRFGIKPLFYAPGRELFAFASELNALCEVPGINLQPNPQAIYDFASLFYIPAPDTFYQGIKALEPGELIKAQLVYSHVSWQKRAYHCWAVAPNTSLTLERASSDANDLLDSAVRQQLESDVPIGSLLSGGIDSSLVSAVAQKGNKAGIRTFNVEFANPEYNEAWAARAVAEHIGSNHTALNIEDNQGTWEQVVSLLHHAGQPFADTSIFAVNAISKLMRRHVTVALSGDGGDEGFGGYNLFWQLARIAYLQTFPRPVWAWTSTMLEHTGCCRRFPKRLPERMKDLSGADDTAILQNLFCWIREREMKSLWRHENCLSVRRHFDPEWRYDLPRRASRVERLSAHATEINVRLALPNDFLFKVDSASMRESLEVRVPMLDEDLLAYGLTLPHKLKVSGRTCKLVLRKIASNLLPFEISTKPKQGFGIPVDVWVDSDFKVQLRQQLLGLASRLPEYFDPRVYRPWIESFCDNRPLCGVSRQSLYQRVIMLLSCHLSLSRKAA